MAVVKPEEFQSNSIKEKEAKEVTKKKVEKVIKGTVKTRKKGIMSRIGEVFVREDKTSVKEYLIFDVIIPSIKDTILDTISMIFYGSTKRGRNGRVAKSGTRISYADYYKDDDKYEKRDRDRKTTRNEVNNIDDILFETRAEAQEVLNSLADIIDEYGFASVADFCDLCGVTESFTDHKFGWSDVGKSSIESVRGGYFVINLPRARQIE